MMWMEFGCEASLVAEMPETRQHFFRSNCPGFYRIDAENWQAFFELFSNGSCCESNIRKPEFSGRWSVATRSRVTILYQSIEEQGVENKVATSCSLFPSENSGGSRYFFREQL